MSSDPRLPQLPYRLMQSIHIKRCLPLILFTLLSSWCTYTRALLVFIGPPMLSDYLPILQYDSSLCRLSSLLRTYNLLLSTINCLQSCESAHPVVLILTAMYAVLYNVTFRTIAQTFRPSINSVCHII